jgi:uncharacterized iron-regulated membrane protein
VKKTFTLSMDFLHTWCGVVFGWLLFVILLTGSIAVFYGELNYWLTPEIRGGLKPDPQRSLAVGEQYLRANAGESRLWRITLPTTREPVLKVIWRQEDGANTTRLLDPETGGEIARRTEGGSFYLEVHEGLHIDRNQNLTGFIIVCFAGMAMIVACISGVVVHKRIFRDMFLFRPRASPQRAWLDAHNVLGVLALPFHVMMAFTGILLLYWLFIPTAAGVLYSGGNPEFRREANAQEFRQIKGEPGPAATLAPLRFYVERAEAVIGPNRTAYIYVRDPGRAEAVVEVYRERTERVSQQVDQMAFDREGRVLRRLLIAEKSLAFRLQSFAASWHWIEWGGNLARWFYYLAGLMGAGVAATGLVVFTAKRARGRQPTWLRAVEAGNVAGVAGCCIACVAYLWAERLAPVGMADRAAVGVNAFFLVWAATCVHAALRPARQAWAEQLALTAVLAAGVPFLGGHAFRHLATGDWVRIAVDWTLVVTGLLFAAGAWKVWSARPAAPASAPAHGEA